MFATVLHARAIDHLALRTAWDAALATLTAEGTGWLGATSGLSTDGDFLAILAFESREAARITMDDLGEGTTWDMLTPYLESMSFRECPHVRGADLRDGIPANVVELSQGVATDIGRVVEAFEGSVRGEGVVSGLLCWDDDWFTAVALHRYLPDDRPMPAPAFAASQDELTIDTRSDPAVIRPWSVLKLGGSP